MPTLWEINQAVVEMRQAVVCLTKASGKINDSRITKLIKEINEVADIHGGIKK